MNRPNYQRQHPGWGPDWVEHPTWRDWWRLPVSILLFLAAGSPRIFSLLLLGGGIMVAVRVRRRLRASSAFRQPGAPGQFVNDPFVAVLGESRSSGGGAYLGATARGGWRFARAERAVLLLGPPRSGKTSGVIIPSLLSHDGPAVSTSTKPDVVTATAPARVRLGEVWGFDPTGTSQVAGVEQLRWSPITCSTSWDGALRMARAMVTGASVGTGTTDRSHWSKRAQALLAPLLHAAAISDGGIDRVVQWVLGHEYDEPGRILVAAGAELAAGVMVGIANTEVRERSSIYSSAADAIDAYTSSAALAAARDPNFDPDRFVRSRDTIYIDAPADRQHLAAPLVCGLLSEIREATYRAYRNGELSHRVLFALDEVANIAPLDELPQIASEGGGQGLLLLAALQDLSQARQRWGAAADGFLTLFGTKLVLPGIADQQTIESISVALGEYDRRLTSDTRTHHPSSYLAQRSRTTSIHRQRVLSPGEIANIPAGHALHLDGIDWELLSVTPGHAVEPWATLTRTVRSGR